MLGSPVYGPRKDKRGVDGDNGLGDGEMDESETVSETSLEKADGLSAGGRTRAVRIGVKSARKRARAKRGGDMTCDRMGRRCGMCFGVADGQGMKRAFKRGSRAVRE